MFCTGCGTQAMSGVGFCSKCGKALGGVSVTGGYADADNKYSGVFTIPAEQFVEVLGGHNADTFLATGMATQGSFAILSDRKVYFKGSHYQRVGKSLKKRMGDASLDIGYVTGVDYVQTKSIGLLITSILTHYLRRYSHTSLCLRHLWVVVTAGLFK